MNPAQRSISFAFLVLTAGLAVYHHWPSRLATWAGGVPQTGKATPSLVPFETLNDWQAALVLYAIAFAIGGTEMAPGATAASWGLALIVGFGAVNELGKSYPGIFGTAPAAPPAPAAPAPQAQAAGA